MRPRLGRQVADSVGGFVQLSQLDSRNHLAKQRRKRQQVRQLEPDCWIVASQLTVLGNSCGFQIKRRNHAADTSKHLLPFRLQQVIGQVSRPPLGSALELAAKHQRRCLAPKRFVEPSAWRQTRSPVVRVGGARRRQLKLRVIQCAGQTQSPAKGKPWTPFEGFAGGYDYVCWLSLAGDATGARPRKTRFERPACWLASRLAIKLGRSR